MKNALILHGTAGTSQGNWFPWLKERLEEKGWKVWTPDLPGAEKPNTQRYTQYLLSEDWDFNEESVIVGHSSGSVEILALLEALPEGKKIGAAILVGTFQDDLRRDDLKELFLRPFDFEAIRTRAKKFIVIHSDDDPFCPVEGAKEIAEKLGAEFILIPGQKHFSYGTAGEKYLQFPFILDLIEKL